MGRRSSMGPHMFQKAALVPTGVARVRNSGRLHIGLHIGLNRSSCKGVNRRKSSGICFWTFVGSKFGFYIWMKVFEYVKVIFELPTKRTLWNYLQISCLCRNVTHFKDYPNWVPYRPPQEDKNPNLGPARPSGEGETLQIPKPGPKVGPQITKTRL